MLSQYFTTRWQALVPTELSCWPKWKAFLTETSTFSICVSITIFKFEQLFLFAVIYNETFWTVSCVAGIHIEKGNRRLDLEVFHKQKQTGWSDFYQWAKHSGQQPEGKAGLSEATVLGCVRVEGRTRGKKRVHLMVAGKQRDTGRGYNSHNS